MKLKSYNNIIRIPSILITFQNEKKMLVFISYFTIDLVFHERFQKIFRLPVTKFTVVQIGCSFIFTMMLNASFIISFIMVYVQHLFVCGYINSEWQMKHRHKILIYDSFVKNCSVVLPHFYSI